jgi:hypothetical protein
VQALSDDVPEPLGRREFLQHRLHQRIAGLYGGQPGAAVVLLSAFAAIGLALGRLTAVGAEDGRLALRITAPHQTVLATVVSLAFVSLAFARLYADEYAWVWGL